MPPASFCRVEQSLRIVFCDRLFSGAAILPKFGTNRWITLRGPKKNESIVTNMGDWSPQVASVACSTISERIERMKSSR